MEKALCMTAGRIIVADAAGYAASAARTICVKMNEMCSTRGRASLMLAGGSTPQAVYQAIGASDLASLFPWDATDFYFGDERCVPPDDPASNYGMAIESLFAVRDPDPARIHRMEAEQTDRDQAAREYEALLPEALDLILLGIGEDGHIASLFPGSPAISESVRRVVAVCGPKPPPWRLTITPIVIRRARNIFVMVKGTEKARAVHASMEGADDLANVPAQLARYGTWILDDAAAGMLTRDERMKEH